MDLFWQLVTMSMILPLSAAAKWTTSVHNSKLKMESERVSAVTNYHKVPPRASLVWLK